MTSHAESAAAEAGTRPYGFCVSIRSKNLSSGQFRVKLSTVQAVFGAGLTPSVGGPPVDVTLVDDSDSSPWTVRLSATADEQCSVTGLQEWLKHRGAGVAEKLQVERKTGTAYHVSLLRTPAAVPVADGAPAALEQRAPAGAASQPDRVPCNCATPVAQSVAAADPFDPREDASGGSGAGPRLGGRGWERLNALPAQPHNGSMRAQPAAGPHPDALNRTTAAMQVKVDPDAGVGGQQGRQQGSGEAKAWGQEPGLTSEQRPPRGIGVQQQLQDQQQPGVQGATAEGAAAALRVAVKQEPGDCKYGSRWLTTTASSKRFAVQFV